MSDVDDLLTEIESYEGKATSAPWEGDGGGNTIHLTFDHDHFVYPPLGESGPVAVIATREDQEFMVHARRDLPLLVKALRRAMYQREGPLLACVKSDKRLGEALAVMDQEILFILRSKEVDGE